MEPDEFNRLTLEPELVTAATLLAQWRADTSGHADRPHLAVNFVATADGSVSWGGRSGPLGDEGDHAMFHALREHADAVLAGTGTLAVECYGRILRRPERRERRQRAGLSSEPLACVITRSGELPLEIPLFACEEAEVVVFTPRPARMHDVAARMHLERYDATAPQPLAAVMRTLRRDYGVERLLCEGGPTLFGSLLHERLVDELFLTLVPKLTGGSAGPTLATGAPLPDLAELELRWALERAGSLYLRYGLDARRA